MKKFKCTYRHTGIGELGSRKKYARHFCSERLICRTCIPRPWYIFTVLFFFFWRKCLSTPWRQSYTLWFTWMKGSWSKGSCSSSHQTLWLSRVRSKLLEKHVKWKLRYYYNRNHTGGITSTNFESLSVLTYLFLGFMLF